MKLLLSGAQRHVLRALLNLLECRPDRQKLCGIVESFETSDWSSLTFAGSRHVLEIRVSGAVDDQLAGDLAAMDFAIPGHIVASVALTAAAPCDGSVVVTIEVMTVASPAFRFDVASTSSTSTV